MNNREILQLYYSVYHCNTNKPNKELANLYLRMYHDCMNVTNNKHEICKVYYDKFLTFVDTRKNNE